MRSVNFIFPHQLFKHNELFNFDGEYYLIEENLFFTQYNFHQQKIAFHRATMKCYEHFLQTKGFKVNYIEAHEQNADVRQLISFLADNFDDKRMKFHSLICLFITPNCESINYESITKKNKKVLFNFGETGSF